MKIMRPTTTMRNLIALTRLPIQTVATKKTDTKQV